MKIFRRYIDRRDGTTAIEFSLLAVPFMLTCISLIELSLYFASASMLESAAQSSARLIKTGQLQQTTGDPLTEFLDEVCNQAGFLMDCSKFQYQVIKMNDFNSDTTPTLDSDGNMTPPDQFEVNSMTAGCVGLVRITYPFQFITPFFSSVWGEYGGTRIIMSTVAFQVEPYDFNVTDPTCSV